MNFVCFSEMSRSRVWISPFLSWSFDSANCFLQCTNDIAISFFVKANVAVADLRGPTRKIEEACSP